MDNKMIEDGENIDNISVLIIRRCYDGDFGARRYTTWA